MVVVAQFCCAFKRLKDRLGARSTALVVMAAKIQFGDACLKQRTKAHRTRFHGNIEPVQRRQTIDSSGFEDKKTRLKTSFSE